MSKKRLLSIVVSAVILLSFACTAMAAEKSERYVGDSTVNGSIYQTYYQVDAQTRTGVKKISVSGVLYEKGTIGTWQKVSSCSNSSTTSTCMVSSSFNTKPGKSYRLEYSATFSYSDGRSETITGSTSVIYFSKLERCEVIIKARPTRVIRYLAIVALCLLLGFMLGRKSKYEKRDYLKQFKIGKATYSESLIYEAYGGLQNDGIMLAVYYDVDAAKIIHQLDSWEKINDSPTISSILKNVSSYFGLDFVIPEIASGNFFLYDNSQHKELRSEAEMNTLLLHSEDVNFSLVVWDDEKHTIYIEFKEVRYEEVRIINSFSVFFVFDKYCVLCC